MVTENGGMNKRGGKQVMGTEKEGGSWQGREEDTIDMEGGKVWVQEKVVVWVQESDELASDRLGDNSDTLYWKRPYDLRNCTTFHWKCLQTIRITRQSHNRSWRTIWFPILSRTLQSFGNQISSNNHISPSIWRIDQMIQPRNRTLPFNLLHFEPSRLVKHPSYTRIHA